MSKKLYDLAINVGLAGSFDDAIKIGDVVNVMSDRIAGLGAEDGEKFLSLIDMDLLEDEDFSLQNGEMQNTIPISNKVVESLPKVKGITVNTTHGNEASIEKVKALFAPQVETMEGAAFLYACLLEGISCIQLRAISNKVERRNKKNWDIKLAVQQLTDASVKFINELPAS